MADAPREIRLSSTILLLRDRRNALEVFMVQRHHQIDFATGALVFPGGKVDAQDAGHLFRAHCEGVDDIDDDGVTVRVAAIRETFEEARVLLARPRGEAALVSSRRTAQIDERARVAVAEGQRSFLSLLEEEELVLACDLLIPFAHWITPNVMPKRFDTHFYLVAAPEDQLALHDGGEAVDSTWITPEAAIRAEAEGKHTIIFPTLTNVKKLARSRSVAQAIEAAQASRIVTVEPRVAKDEAGILSLFIPEEADYGFTKTSVDALR